MAERKLFLRRDAGGIISATSCTERVNRGVVRLLSQAGIPILRRQAGRVLPKKEKIHLTRKPSPRRNAEGTLSTEKEFEHTSAKALGVKNRT